MTVRGLRLRRTRVYRQPRARARILEGQLGALSVRAAMSVGAWVGFVLGLVLGAILGALLCWFADAALQWQRDLGLTLGVAQNLLPLGDEIPALRTIGQMWYLVIPAAAFVVGLVWAVLAALVAGLITTAYNRASVHARVLVELPAAEIAALEQALLDETKAASSALGPEGPCDDAAGLSPLALPPIELRALEGSGSERGTRRTAESVEGPSPRSDRANAS